MPTISLRDLMEQGFCKSYESPKWMSRGTVHFIMDKMLAEASYSDFDCYQQDSYRIQACNQNDIPYSRQEYAHKILSHFPTQGKKFKSADIRPVVRNVLYKDGFQVELVTFGDISSETFLEPCYDFYDPQYDIPIYTLMSLYLLGKVGQAKIARISMIGDFVDEGTYPIREKELEKILEGWIYSDFNAGPQCANCMMSGCKFKTDFEAIVHRWMKAQKDVDAAEAQIKSFLTINGPSRSGSHTFFMKESRRRNFVGSDAEKSLALKALGVIIEQWKYKLLNLDYSALRKAVTSGQLSENDIGPILKMWKEYRFYTIDSSLSPM